PIGLVNLKREFSMDTVLKAKRLIDGSGAPALDDPVVLIRDESIWGVFQGRLPDGIASADAHVVELGNGTILPGLIDCHVHLNLPGDGTSFVDSVREPDG